MQSADVQLIEQPIARGIAVPCGSIHRGPVDRPTGSGHWLIILGPTLNPNGMGLRCSRLKFGKRWMVEPIGGGAFRPAPGKGRAVVVVDSVR